MVLTGEHFQSDLNGLEKEKQASEILILQKTIEEMDKRILTQKRTLQARDDSITRLLEMLKNKGDTPSDEVSQQLQNLEALLVHKQAGAQADITQLKMVHFCICLGVNQLFMSKIYIITELDMILYELRRFKTSLKNGHS